MLLAVFIAGAMVSCVVETRRVVPRSNAEAMKRPSTVLGEYSTENLNLSSRLYNEARYLSESDTLVTNLPGLTTEDASKIKQHAGYLHLSGNVGAIFYWMFENPDPDAPLILWFNGGPGCSSMDGLFLELGPLRLVPGGAGSTDTLKVNPYSWHNVGNLVFIDQPIGTGLSYSRGKYASNDREVNIMLYEALLELLRLYPKFVGTPTAAAGGSATPTSRRLFLTGESHAGHYIPSFGAYLLKRNEAPDASIKINLAGIAIGNGWTDPSNQYDVSDFVYGMGIISSAQREELKAREKVCHSSLSRGILASKACFSLLDDALDASGYGKLSRASMYDIRLFEHTSSYPPGHDAVERYLNRADVRKALHVGPLTGRYVECADPPYNALSHQDGLGAVGELVQLLHAQIPVLLFSGQFDVICNHIGTQRMLDKMEWNGNAGWRAAKSAVWSADGKDPSGYIKSYQNLNFLSVLDSGHMVPLSKPKESLDMIRRFVQGKPFADIPSKVGSKVPIQSTGIGSVPSVTFNCSDIAEIMGSSKVQNVIAPAAIAAPKLSLPPIPLDASVALYLDSSEALSGGGAVRVKISPSGSLFEKNASSILIRGLENGKSVGIELQYILAGKLTSSTTYAMVTPGCYNPGKVQCCGAGTCVYDTKNTRGQCMCDAGRFGANCEERGSAGGPNHCPNVPQYPLLDRSKAADVSTAAKSNCGSGNCAVRIRLSLLISVDSRMNIFNDQGAIDSFELLLETELVSILKCEVAECIFALKIEQGQAIMTSEAFNAELIVFSHSGAVVDNIVAQLISQLRSNNSPLRFGLLTRYITQDYNIFLDQSLAETGIKPVFRKKETSTIIIDSNRDSYLKWGQALLIVVIAVTVMEAGRRVYSRFLPERRPVTRISLVPI